MHAKNITKIEYTANFYVAAMGCADPGSGLLLVQFDSYNINQKPYSWFN